MLYAYPKVLWGDFVFLLHGISPDQLAVMTIALFALVPIIAIRLWRKKDLFTFALVILFATGVWFGQTVYFVYADSSPTIGLFVGLVLPPVIKYKCRQYWASLKRSWEEAKADLRTPRWTRKHRAEETADA